MENRKTVIERLSLSEWAFDKVPPHRWEVILDVVTKTGPQAFSFQRYNVLLNEPCSIPEAQNLALTYLFQQCAFPITEVLAVRCERQGEPLRFGT